MKDDVEPESPPGDPTLTLEEALAHIEVLKKVQSRLEECLKTTNKWFNSLIKAIGEMGRR